MGWIIWIILAIIVDVIYHKIFDVVYFQGGFIREIIGVFIVSGILYAFLLFGFAKLTGQVPEEETRVEEVEAVEEEKESIIFESDEIDQLKEYDRQNLKYLDSTNPMEFFQKGVTIEETIEILGEPSSIEYGTYYYKAIGYKDFMGSLYIGFDQNFVDEPEKISYLEWYTECDDISTISEEAKRLVQYYSEMYGSPERNYNGDTGVENFYFTTKDYQTIHIQVADGDVCELAMGLNIDYEFYAMQEENKDSSFEETETEEEFIFPESNEYEIYESELEFLSDWELCIARNEILARYGCKFKNSEIQEYFNSCSWYEGTIEPGTLDTSLLNEVEKRNIEIIKNEEAYRSE